MVLDKALLVKGAVGAASVAGLGGIVVFRKELGIVKSSKPTEDKPVAKDGKSQQDTQQPDRASSGSQVSDGSSGSGVPGAHTPTNSLSSTSQDTQVDALGIPTNCNNSCDLTAENLKQIKFKKLEDIAEGNVTVNIPSGTKITLTIKGANGNKRYIFENGGTEQVTLTKGSATVNLSVGKTRFVNENNKLKEMETGNYGLPEKCKENNPCTLTEDDLGLVKFSGFTDGKESTVRELSENKTITLTIENSTYIFNNSGQSTVTIQRDSATVDLVSGETEFKGEGDKLKKVVLGEFGLTEDCQLVDDSNPKTCTLTPRDLKKVKFKDIGDSPTVSGLDNNANVTLKIEKIDDSSYPDRTKYTFTPGGSSDVTIGESSQSVTLSKTKENIFKKDIKNNVLVEIPKREKPSFETSDLDNKISNLGLPTTCTFKDKASGDSKSIECELSLEELKNLKFDGKDSVTLTGGHGGENGKNYKLKIEETNNEKQFESQNIRITFLNRGNNAWNSRLTIKSGDEDSNPIIIYNNSDTEFKINNQNKLEKAWTVSDLSGMVGLNCTGAANNASSPCSVKNGNETIKVLFEGESSIKDFKPSDFSLLDLTPNGCGDNHNQGFKFNVSNGITGTVDGKSREVTSEHYEIKRVGGDWALSITSSEQ